MNEEQFEALMERAKRMNDKLDHVIETFKRVEKEAHYQIGLRAASHNMRPSSFSRCSFSWS